MRAWIATLALLYGCAGHPPPVAEVDGGVRYGPIDGFTQIPRAGSAGSTSSNRPTFHELGVTDALIYDVHGRIGLGPNAVFGGYRTLFPSGTATIGEPLESQGSSIPAGSTLDVKDEFDVTQVGYERTLALGIPVVLAPRIGFAFFRVSNRIDGPSVEVSRGFSRGNLMLGFRAELPIDPALSFEIRAFATPPIPNVPTLYSIEGRATWHPLGWLGLFVGLGGDRYEFEDTERPAHNDVRVVLGPLFIGGVELIW